MTGSDDGGDAIDPVRRRARERRVLGLVTAINLGCCAIMLSAALYSGSSALLAGTLDNFGDALTYLLSLAVVGAGLRAKARVALLKGLLVLGAALAVAAQIAWRLAHPGVPLFEAMGLAAAVNLVLNAVCLWLLMPLRGGDINLASAWETSRNDVLEGLAVLAAAPLVWLFGAGWPDLAIAAVLLVLFLGSAFRILAAARRALAAAPAA